MTQSPPIPRSRRNLNDLDSLIDASIGKRETYGSSRPDTEERKSDPEPGHPTQVTSPPPDPSASADAPLPDLFDDHGSPDEAKQERFRISIDASVIMATKMLAIQQKTSPSDIVERALRSYLNLPASSVTQR